MFSDSDLRSLAEQVAARLRSVALCLVTAESCTGGWIGKTVTDLPGSSAWYKGGLVVYSNELKEQLLGVSPVSLQTHGAVSEVVAREMACGALKHLKAEVALSVTGIAGPDGGQPQKPVGTVWFGWAWRDMRGVIHERTALETFRGDRDRVRRQSVERALREVLLLPFAPNL